MVSIPADTATAVPDADDVFPALARPERAKNALGADAPRISC
jgi:hypothetical protein